MLASQMLAVSPRCYLTGVWWLTVSSYCRDVWRLGVRVRRRDGDYAAIIGEVWGAQCIIHFIQPSLLEKDYWK